jgi:hypothetical protein
MITNLVILAFIVGLLSGAVIAGARSWASSLGLNMNWWKWLLAALWYLLLLFVIFAAFTLMGEGESGAGWKVLGISLVFLVILGAGLAKILLGNRNHDQD